MAAVLFLYGGGSLIERAWTRTWHVDSKEFDGQVFRAGGLRVLFRRLVLGWIPMTIILGFIVYQRYQRGLDLFPGITW